MDALTFWEMHLSDVLLGVSDWISVWSSGENRTRCVETQLSHRNRRGGEIWNRREIHFSQKL